MAIDGRSAHNRMLIQPRTVLLLVVVATILANLEVGLVNVALPTLAATFDVGPTTIQWVAIAYQMAIIGTLVPFGRLVDLLGGRVLYLAGMATMAVASILAAVSLSALWLILARGFLGVGAAVLLATGQALLTVAYQDEGRGRALGVMHMAVAGGLMTGPALGGLLINLASWRTIFLAPIPLAAVAIGWGWRTLPRPAGQSREPLDIGGALLTFVAAVAGVFGLTRAAQGWDAPAAALLVLALAAGVLFIVLERRQAAPLVDLSLLRRWSFSAGLLAAFLTFIALAANMFLIPFALQDLMGHSAAVAGLVMMIVPLAILPVAPLAGALADRFGTRIPATAGLVAIVVAIVGMSTFQRASSLWFAASVLVVYGIGAGLFQAPNNSAVLGLSLSQRTGIVSGMLALSRNLGQVVGIAVASTAWTWRQSYYEQLPTPVSGGAMSAGLRDAFLVLAGFGLLALVTSALRVEPRGATDGA